MAYRLGRDCTLSIAGVEVIRATDVSPTLTANEVDTTTRQEGVWSGMDVGHNKWGVSFSMKHYINDTALATIRAAFIAQEEVAVAFTGGAMASLSGVGKITRFDSSEPLSDVVTVDVDVVGNGALA